MLRRLEMENFKGSRERVVIDLAPVTLVFGPNSAGKSSVLQAIHYLYDVSRGNLDAGATQLGGDATNLGASKS